MHETLSAIVELEPRFQWGPYILLAIGVVVGIGGFFIRRLIVALDKAVEAITQTQQDVAVVKTMITSGIEARLTNLEGRDDRGKNQ